MNKLFWVITASALLITYAKSADYPEPPPYYQQEPPLVVVPPVVLAAPPEDALERREPHCQTITQHDDILDTTDWQRVCEDE